MNTNYMDINIKVDKQCLILNEDMLLIIEIKNNTSESLENVLLRNFIDNYYISIKDRVQNITYDDFINIGSFSPGQQKNLKFVLNVKRIPENFQLSIYSLLNFYFQINHQIKTVNIKSNVIDLNFYMADIYGINGENFQITSSKNNYSRNESIGYNVKITNTGNICAQKISLRNYIPKGTALIKDSIFFYGKSDVEIDSDCIFIDRMDPMEEVFINYNVQVMTSLEEDFIDNQIKINYMYLSPNNVITSVEKNCKDFRIFIDKSTKESDISNDMFFDEVFIDEKKLLAKDKDLNTISIKSNLKCNTVLLNSKERYFIELSNEGNCYYEKIKVNINLPQCFTYVANSLIVNGMSMDMGDLRNYIEVGSLGFGESIYIEFEFDVTKIPYKKQAVIDVEIDANFLDSKNRLDSKKFKNASDIIQVEKIYLQVIKRASKRRLIGNDIVDIQTTLTNRGSVDLFDIFIVDNDDSNLEFLGGSLFLSNNSYSDFDLNKGVNISKLDVGQTVTITSKHKYISNARTTNINIYSKVNYQYKFNEDTDLLIEYDKSNSLSLQWCLFEIEKFSIESKYKINLNEPDVSEIRNVISEVLIKNYYEINTVNNLSYENSKLTGKKVIINGVVKNKIEYLVDDENNSLYLTTRETLFNTFINIPSEYDCNYINLNPKCEDIYFKLMDKRSLFITNFISIK